MKHYLCALVLAAAVGDAKALVSPVDASWRKPIEAAAVSMGVLDSTPPQRKPADTPKEVRLGVADLDSCQVRMTAPFSNHLTLLRPGTPVPLRDRHGSGVAQGPSQLPYALPESSQTYSRITEMLLAVPAWSDKS